MMDQMILGTNFSRMLRVNEAAKILRIHPNTLRKWSCNGTIPSYRIGSRRDRRFALEDLVNILSRE